MMVVGITGPTGSGKTTALNVIRELGGLCTGFGRGLSWAAENRPKAFG